MLQPHDLYFFIYPPLPLIRLAAHWLNALGPSCLAGNAKPMAEERAHVTVEKLGRFLGGIPDSARDRATAAGDAVAAQPFDVSFDLLRSTPGPDGRGTAELTGRGEGLRGLRNFERSLADAMRGVGCEESQIRRHFRPHMTLDYGYGQALRQAIPPIAWRVTQFMLVDSLYGLGEHKVLRCWSLESRQQELACW